MPGAVERGVVIVEIAASLAVLLLLLTGYAHVFRLIEQQQRLVEAVEMAARAGAQEPLEPVKTAREVFDTAAAALGISGLGLRCNVRMHELQLSNGQPVVLLEVAASREGYGACVRSHFLVESGVVAADHEEDDTACFPAGE